jgi:hypothetical protein
MKIFKTLVLLKKQNIKNTLIYNNFFLAIIHKYMAENAEEIMKMLLIDFMIWALCWRHTSKWLMEQDSVGHTLNTFGTDMHLAHCKSKLCVVVMLKLCSKI